MHVLPAIRLDGRWIRCDPSDDRLLSESTAHLNPQSKVVEFDGKTDAVLNLNPGHIVLDEGRQAADIDAILTKTRRRTDQFLELLRRYLDFLRAEGKRHASLQSIGDAFFLYLRRSFPVDYRLLVGGSVMGELDAAERTTESLRLQEDALWFAAQGHLMKLDSTAALITLERVEALDGRRAAAARDLAGDIRALDRSQSSQ